MFKVNRTFSFSSAYNRPEDAEFMFQRLTAREDHLQDFFLQTHHFLFFPLFSKCMNGGSKHKMGEGYRINKEAGDSEKQAKSYESVKGWNFMQ